MSKIGVLYICTGEYTVFWREFYISAEQYFLKNSEVHYFVFTDAEKIEFQDVNPRIHVIYQEGYGWPFSTLLRFSIFLNARKDLQKCDYVFFFNANAKFVTPVDEEQFLPRSERGEELLVVRHPGFYNKKKYEYTYDRNPKCSAYIPYRKGDIYVCGGINGGTTDAFLTMCDTLSRRINKDLEKSIIPEWHDESHINRYILDRNDIRVLTPSFCYPEGWDLPFDCLILIRDKKNYININQLRKDAPETRISFVYRVQNRIARIVVRLLLLLKE